MITHFKDEYSWLSNFEKVQIEFEGRLYPSVEHAYIAAKSEDQGWRELCTTTKYRAGDLKEISEEIELRDGWDDMQVFVMYDILKTKFIKNEYRTKLLNTGDMELIHGNWWGDDYYGVDVNTDEGQNILGRLLMKIRKELRDGKY